MSIWDFKTLLFVIPLCVGCLLAVGAAFGLGEGGAADDDASTALEIGQPPLLIRWMTFCLTFGALGLAASYVLGTDESKLAQAAFAATIALICAWIAVRFLRHLFVHHLRLLESHALTRRELVGSLGNATLAVGTRGGLAQVRDRNGNLHQVACRIADGEAPLSAGTGLLLVDYDAERNLYEVVRRPNALD